MRSFRDGKAPDCPKLDEFDADQTQTQRREMFDVTRNEEVEIRVDSIDPWYLENLVCPIDHTELHIDDLISKRGRRYPVVEGLPVLLVTEEEGHTLLDIGCNWGRWSIAAARKGFSMVGIDPSLGAVTAARRIAKELNLDIKYLVADGRFLPFRERQFKVAYSYSVLQHLSKGDARKTISQISRVLEPGGLAKIQMANRWGLRSLQHQARRKFRDPKDFQVLYWTIAELKATFSEIVGTTHISADCYFGLGWQWCGFRLVLQKHKFVLMASEALRRLSDILWPIRMFADREFCTATKPRSV
jgi:2-polyprenyl-3-methyl-5-hydroxy-6-metoxy-1,4-benzoquinol methylase